MENNSRDIYLPVNQPPGCPGGAPRSQIIHPTVKHKLVTIFLPGPVSYVAFKKRNYVFKTSWLNEISFRGGGLGGRWRRVRGWWRGEWSATKLFVNWVASSHSNYIVATADGYTAERAAVTGTSVRQAASRCCCVWVPAKTQGVVCVGLQYIYYRLLYVYTKQVSAKYTYVQLRSSSSKFPEFKK